MCHIGAGAAQSSLSGLDRVQSLVVKELFSAFQILTKDPTAKSHLFFIPISFE